MRILVTIHITKFGYVNSGSPYLEMYYPHLQICRWKWRVIGVYFYIKISKYGDEVKNEEWLEMLSINHFKIKLKDNF